MANLVRPLAIWSASQGTVRPLIQPLILTMRLLGKIFVFILLLIAAGAGYAFWQGPILDTESKTYVDMAVPAIVSTWNKQELARRASPELIQSVKTDDVSGLLLQFSRRLGALSQYDGSQGDSHLGFTLKGLIITANYTAKARFQRGSAVIRISLIKHGEQWQVLGFHVESPVLLQ